ncbi:MAG: CoA transferase [Chloroflexi bacterium]|nr:CoA transferase [Chloroflexota bacterium]
MVKPEGRGDATMSQSALSDLKVVEYGQFISAPYCAKRLASLGAEVVKVEPPGVGDMARRMGPFRDDIPHPERSGLFLYLNMNKLGTTLDVANPRGKKIFLALIKDADILVENNPPQRMEELGLDYPHLREANPRIIMTSITPFGQTGPYRDYKGNDLIAFHTSGMAYDTRGPVADPNAIPPIKAGGRQADYTGGVLGAAATMSALFYRHLTDEGQHVDVSQQEALAIFLRAGILSYTGYDPSHIRRPLPKGPQPIGGFLPYTPLPCKDGMICFQSIEEYQWWNFVEIMGNPEWAADERFVDNTTRRDNMDALYPLLAQWTMQHTREEIYHAAQANHCTVFPVNTVEDLFKARQLQEREFFVELEHPEAGPLRYPGAPYKLSETPAQINSAAPLLGQHNEEILCQRLGYSPEELAIMHQMRII